eukprot:CAMPEP_0172447946 /NCGR_PEP_ID=MMETSP1065-20121228/7082_1 /TAXON_ID=265537 /ORGANISM="Amphiprora paludosa, Strain CCMP125" /LENGTH=278 /DNA_ID=CAMNT_0013199319 /DNA_START=63 /DNA_END=899 /DNA_ORIENTATION=-
MLFTSSPLSSLSSSFPAYWSSLTGLASPRDATSDGASVTSTISAGPSLPLKKRRVRFQMAHVYHAPVFPYVTDPELAQRWYTPEEYRLLKLDYKATLRQTVARGNYHAAQAQHLHAQLQQDHHSPDQHNHAMQDYEQHVTFLQALHRVYETCCQAESPLDEQVPRDHAVLSQLAHCLAHYPDIHGLEKALSRQLSDDKSFRRTEVLETVLSLQSEINDELDEFFVEMMRCASENLSRPARLLAQSLAQAQALTFEEMDHDQDHDWLGDECYSDDEEDE